MVPPKSYYMTLEPIAIPLRPAHMTSVCVWQQHECHEVFPPVVLESEFLISSLN